MSQASWHSIGREDTIRRRTGTLSDTQRLQALRASLGRAAVPHGAVADDAQVRLGGRHGGGVDVSGTGSGLSRHPAVLLILGFVLTGFGGCYLTSKFNSATQERQIAANAESERQRVAIETRNNAIAAVSNMSDLVNERRERAVLVISSIERGAPQAETEARKTAYDDAYIRWNARIPGDLLRVRAGLGAAYRSSYQRYVDGLTSASALLRGTDADVLLHGQSLPKQYGLFSVMDACLTQAYDQYRADSFASNKAAVGLVNACKFFQVYSQSISCFSMIAESLYSAVNGIDGVPTLPISDSQVVEACKP